MKVWIVSYSHSHGTNITVYGTEKKAGAGVIESMVCWFDDLEDRFFLPPATRNRIRRAMKKGDYQNSHRPLESQYGRDL